MTISDRVSGNHLILVLDADDIFPYPQLSGHLPECDIIVRPYDNAREFYLQNDPDLMILNHTAGASCMEHLRYYRSVNSSVPVIIMTDNGSEEFAVKAFRNGASDYWKMPLDVHELKKLIRKALATGSGKKRRKSDYCFDAFRTAVQYIDENYNEKITLPRIAKEAGMSVSCFERTFKKHMGETFISYVNNLRISGAKKMLGTKSLPISEIAFHNGFTNQYHFTRTFKKIAGVTPRQYRTSVR